jgi:hypothetical protein
MPKEFITERDIVDMFNRGEMTLHVNENTALTELAYEKANRLGVQLVRSQPDNPPCAPIRPYIVQKPNSNAPVMKDALPANKDEGDLHARIRQAVLSSMGSQLDGQLLDVIIQRVLKSTGVK